MDTSTDKSFMSVQGILDFANNVNVSLVSDLLDRQINYNTGIVTKGVDNTIANIGILARQGMQQTDKIILEIMTSHCS